MRFLANVEESAIPVAKQAKIAPASATDFPTIACHIVNWAGDFASAVEIVSDTGALTFVLDTDWCTSQGALKMTAAGSNLCPLTAGTTVTVSAGQVDACTPNPTLVTVTVTPPPQQYWTKQAAVSSPAPSATQNPALDYPVFWSVEPPLPDGLSADPTTGVITGTPLFASPTQSYVIKASTGGGAGTANFTAGVQAVANTVTVATIADQTWTHGTPITNVTGSATDSDGSIATFTWSISPALPGGVSLNTGTSVISGTPAAAAAQATYTLTATDRTGASGSTNFKITVS